VALLKISIDWKRLFEAAEIARRLAHAPYSKFQVGAAVLAADGSVHRGCNVENASYGMTMCAERNALARAVVEGQRPVAVALVVDSRRPTPPCGACRQVLSELCAPETPVRTRTSSGKEKKYTVRGLPVFRAHVP
jgi:cytidine deaminase